MKLTFKVIVALLLVLVVSFALLLWRLSSSPIQLNQFVPSIEQAASDLPGGRSIKLRGMDLFWDRAERHIDLRALDVELLGSSGASLLKAPQVDVSLSVIALMHGVLALSSLELVDIDVHLVRNEDGSFQVLKRKKAKRPAQAAASEETGSRNYLEIVQHVFNVLASEADHKKPISYLKNVKIKGSLEVEDRKRGVYWTAETVETMFVGHKGEIKGDLSVILETPRSLAGTSADVALSVKQEAVTANLKIAGLNPVALAQFDQRLSAVAGLDMTFEGDIRLAMSLPDKIQGVEVDVTGSAGQFSYRDYYPTPLKVNSFDLQLNFDIPGKSLQVSGLDVSLGEAEFPLKLRSSGAAQIINDSVSINLDTQLQKLKVDEFDLYWPRGIAKGSRSWLVNNLKAGMVDNTNLQLAMIIPTGPEAEFELKQLEGTVAYSGLTVSYFGSLSPATGVNGSGTYNKHGFDLDIAHGLVNGVSIDSGKVIISGLDNKKAAIAIDTRLSGGLSPLFSALEARPIELSRITGIDSDELGGQVESDFSISLPLRSGLADEEIKYHANGRISGGSRQNLVGKYGAQAANVKFQLDRSSFQLDGPMEIAGIPLTLDWKTSLTGDNPGQSDFTIDAPNISSAEIGALGFKTSNYVKGSLGLKAKARLVPGGVLTGTVNSDLSKTELSVPQIRWYKASGEEASIEFTVHAEKNRFQAKNISVVLGNLQTYKNAELNVTDSQLSLLFTQVSLGSSVVENLQLKRTAGGHVNLTVDGGELNLEPFLHKTDQQNPTVSDQLVAETKMAASQLESSGIVFRIEKSRLDRIYLNKEAYFEDISFDARRDTEGWQELRLSGHHRPSTMGPTSRDQPVANESLQSGQFNIEYGPRENGRYPVNIELANLGLMVSAIKGRNIMQGGHLVLSGESAGPLLTQPINATFEVDNFTVKEAPGVSQILNMASLSQLLSSLNNTGLAFNSFSGDLKLDGTHLSSKKVHAEGGSLGLIGSGLVDLKLQSVDMHGTVVPFSNVNNVIGMIPVLGKAVVGPDGKGLMAIEYTLKGDMNNPEVKIRKKTATSKLLEDVLDIGKEAERNGSK